MLDSKGGALQKDSRHIGVHILLKSLNDVYYRRITKPGDKKFAVWLFLSSGVTYGLVAMMRLVIIVCGY